MIDTNLTLAMPENVAQQKETPDPKQLEAAKQFEAIFLRQMLSGLEKAGQIGGGAVTSGSGIYGSMMVGALADAAANGGGIGLSELVLRALTPPPSQQK